MHYWDRKKQHNYVESFMALLHLCWFSLWLIRTLVDSPQACSHKLSLFATRYIHPSRALTLTIHSYRLFHMCVNCIWILNATRWEGVNLPCCKSARNRMSRGVKEPDTHKKWQQLCCHQPLTIWRWGWVFTRGSHIFTSIVLFIVRIRISEHFVFRHAAFLFL